MYISYIHKIKPNLWKLQFVRNTQLVSTVCGHLCRYRDVRTCAQQEYSVVKAHLKIYMHIVSTSIDWESSIDCILQAWGASNLCTFNVQDFKLKQGSFVHQQKERIPHSSKICALEDVPLYILPRNQDFF